jgi:short-subunit dehydrogenase
VKIQGKKIILTGAASGIGKALLNQLLDYEGVTVLAVDIQALDYGEQSSSKTTSSPQKSDKKSQLISFQADMANPVEIDKMFEFALAQMGAADILIANAGFAYYEKLGEPNWARLEKIFQVNVLSPIYALQKMQQINQNRPYYVLMTASAMAKLGVPGYAVYGASKAALGRFEDAFRFEKTDLGKLGLVYPIATRTNFFAATGKPEVPVPFPSQTPEQVARAMIRGIEGNRRAIYPSTLFWLLRFPQWLYEWVNLPYQMYYARVLNHWLKDK